MHADAVAVRSIHEKNPNLALVLSLLLPGAGQFYNGETKKGVLMFLGASVGGILTLGLMYLVMTIWSMVDAYKVANQEKTPRKKDMAPPGLSEAEV
ncbi:DUF5683 domain-containing protein [Archangium lipolyticum]|uniref:DUF5683 domain-containing protein n=1 Tax=Archangium lipolyticum TaxID=2970465 RepID=UPI002149C3E7|nr:DUF5683 domain-containing protein [Archangium lipolyticum]